MKTKYISGITLCSAFVALFQILFYPYIFKNGFSNIKYYFVLLITYSVLFFAFFLIIKEYDIDIFEKYKNYIWIFFDFLVIVWCALMFFKEEESYYFFIEFSLRHRIPSYLYLFSLYFFSFIVGCIILVLRSCNKRIRYLFIFLLSSIQSVVLIAPNIINDRGGNLYHIHAYYNSIYNFVEGYPFNDIVKSIYGHYPIIYFFPVKLLQFFNIPTVYAVMIVATILGFFSFFLLYVSLSKFILKDGLFYSGIIIISYISFYYCLNGQYYQMIPHRILFPSIIIFCASCYKNKKIHNYISLLICTISLIWNFETGIVCTLSLILYMCVYQIFLLKSNIVKAILKNIIIFVFSFVASFLVIDFANLIMGGENLTLTEYIFPLFSNDFKIEELAIKIPTPFSVYFLETTVIISSFLISILNILYKKYNKENCILLAVTVMSLGLLTYYFNRPAFGNNAIVHMPFCFVFVIIVQKICNSFENTNFKLYFKITKLYSFCVVISFFALASLTGIPLTISNRLETSWDTTSYKLLLDVFETEIPRDTTAAGIGLPDIYSSLGWEPQIHIMDWADWECSGDIIRYVNKEIDDSDSMVVDEASNVFNYLNTDEWIIIKNIADSYHYIIRENKGNQKSNILYYSDENHLSNLDFIDLCFLNVIKDYPSEEIEYALLNKLEEGLSREECYDYVVALKSYIY